MTKLTQPIKWLGGKKYLASKIVALMPPHLHYVEPFFGGGAVLLAKDTGNSEVVNDINGRLINFWRILRDKESFVKFKRQVEAIPFARKEWTDAHSHTYGHDPVADAVAFFVDARQSRSANMKNFAPLSKNRIRRKMNEQTSAWIKAVDGLAAVHKRLRSVVIENLPALKLITQQDGPNTLFYCDPPYVHKTRVSTNSYEFEMTDEDHKKLLNLLLLCKGKVIVSGYKCQLYNEMLINWQRHVFDLPNNIASGIRKKRMIESLWLNF